MLYKGHTLYNNIDISIFLKWSLGRSSKMQKIRWIIAMGIIIIVIFAVSTDKTMEVDQEIEIEVIEETQEIEEQEIELVKQYTGYTIELSVDEACNYFEGIAQIAYTHDCERITRQIIMSTNGAEIKDIKINLDAVKFIQRGSEVVIYSPFTLEKDEELTITIEYKGALESNTFNVVPAIVPYDESSGWVQIKEEDKDHVMESANYDVTVHTHRGKYPIGTGTISNISEKEDIITTSLNASRVRAFKLFVGEEMEVEVLNTEEGYSIVLYGADKNQLPEDLMPEIKKNLKLYSNTFGAYPYEQLTVIQKEGLEIKSYPRLIIGDFSGPGVVGETINQLVGKQWLPYIIGNSEESDYWLSEGLLKYLSTKFSFNLFYEIEQRIGKEDFAEALRIYYKNYSFHKARGEDLMIIIREVSGVDVMDIYNNWNNKIGPRKSD